MAAAVTGADRSWWPMSPELITRDHRLVREHHHAPLSSSCYHLPSIISGLYRKTNQLVLVKEDVHEVHRR
jgi:hypothetical protein